MRKPLAITCLFITINLFIGVLIFSQMFGVVAMTEFLQDFTLNFMLGLAGLYAAGGYISERMDYHINIKHRNAALTGICGLFLILIFGIFSGSTVGYIQDGILRAFHGTLIDEAVNYYVKPFFWIILFASIPAVITGSILGMLIKERNPYTLREIMMTILKWAAIILLFPFSLLFIVYKSGKKNDNSDSDPT